MIMQVISADGVSISPDAGITTEQLAEVGGAKFKPEPCPAAPSVLPSTSQAALCTREVMLIPSSRIEVWVSYRDSNDMVASTPRNSYAVLRTAGYQTGPAGDSWPTVDLARVNFVSPVQINTPLLLGLSGEANTVASATALAKDLLAANKTAAATRVPSAAARSHAPDFLCGAHDRSERLRFGL